MKTEKIDYINEILEPEAMNKMSLLTFNLLDLNIVWHLTKYIYIVYIYQKIGLGIFFSCELHEMSMLFSVKWNAEACFLRKR